MRKFYAADEYKSKSVFQIIKACFVVNQKYDIHMTDIEHFDLSISFGLLANDAPTSFWINFDMYSNPEFLAEVRTNIYAILGLRKMGEGAGRGEMIVVNIHDVIA